MMGQLVGLGWMLTKKITLGRKEGHKNFKPFLKPLLRYPKVERERESPLGNPIRQLSWSCDMELWHFAFYLGYLGMVHSFSPYLTLPLAS